MRRNSRWALAVVVGMVSLAWGPRLQAADGQEAHERIERVLAGELRSPLDFVETPLSMVVTAISEEYDIPIQFDERALEAVAQSPDSEASITIDRVTLRRAIELLLSKIDDVDYVVDGEVLLITSRERAEAMLDVRVYHVGDLVRHEADGPQQGEVDQERVEALRRVLVTNVAKDAWAVNETGQGELCVYADDLFVVTQSQRVHHEIEAVLAKLRAAVEQSSSASGVAAAVNGRPARILAPIPQGDDDPLEAAGRTRAGQDEGPSAQSPFE